MQVIVLRKPTTRVKGRVAQAGVEVSTNVFVLTGAINYPLWNWICKNMKIRLGAGAKYVIPSKTDLDFNVLQHGSFDVLSEIDGIFL